MSGKILTAILIVMWGLNFSAKPLLAGAELSVGTEKSFPPFVFEEDGELAGFEIDLVREITKELEKDA
ncbi:MAG: transporter substrate-binding domain-containing protein, partial [Thermovirgaceae bacterium]